MSLNSKIPGWINKIQFIKFWIMNPCEVPWTAYIETARPISGEIALVLLGFDLREFLTAIFKPKWMRSPRHTRKGRRGKPRRGGIPDISEMLADRIDPDGFGRPDRWYLGPRMLLEWVEVTDRVAWTIFLLEAWDALIFNTIVGVIEADKKICPNIARANRSADFYTYSSGGGGRGPVNVFHLDYAVNVDSPNGWSMSVGPGRYVVTFAGFARKVSGEGVWAGGLSFDDADGTRSVTGPQTTIVEDQWTAFMADGTLYGPGHVYFEGEGGTGFIELSHMKAFLVQIGD